MNCNACVKINPLPQCIVTGAYSQYFITDIIFDAVNTEILARIRNTATGRIVYETFTTDADGEGLIDIYSLFPLMNHIYEISFVEVETNVPARFTITNQDDTTSTGCCIEFEVNMFLEDTNDSHRASTQTC